MKKTTVIYHSADFDGIFCREIARKFLPEAELIGWDHGDAKLPFPAEGVVYVLDLSPDCFEATKHVPGAGEVVSWMDARRLIWIDHHKSSIEKWPTDIPGYRIDGVAACRLAWQWFWTQVKNTGTHGVLEESTARVIFPDLQAYRDRRVTEPLAVQLAGEYDVWDKRDPESEVFQFALRARELDMDDWSEMLDEDSVYGVPQVMIDLISDGALLQRYQQAQDASLVNFRSFLVEFEGLKFLALNTARCNSLTFAAKDVPETGHVALMGFYWNGEHWKVSLYHARGHEDKDLSLIAVKYGGGGHRGACGFQAKILPIWSV
jgi:uncharacterized protein